MPAQIPSGYTRGPILFVGAASTAEKEASLLQFFWEEAGAYGARVLLLPTSPDASEVAHRCADRFTDWESEKVSLLPILLRQDAQSSGRAEEVRSATAILLLGENPVQMATVLGGTPVAQAIRRANARGKAVCCYGAGAALLCEHMIAFDTRSDDNHSPFLQRHLIQFAPGLGITNRVVVDTAPTAPGDGWNRLSRLLHAVAYNPYLIGVGLEADCGAVLYADNTLEIFGENSALVVDGAGISYSDIHEFRQHTPLSILGMQLHVLGPSFTFQIGDRAASPPQPSDIPDEAVPFRE